MATETNEDPAVTTTAGFGRRFGWLISLAVTLALVVLIRSFLVQSFYVPSGSMEPLITPGDRVLVNRLDTNPERGDVVVFDGTEVFGRIPVTPQSPGLIGSVVGGVGKVLGIDTGETDYVKRVIGVGGDRVACAKGVLSVNGQRVDEPYLPAGTASCQSDFDVKVPAEHLFMMGDNRANSADSRAHLGSPGGGMVPVGDVIGAVTWRYWPLDRLGNVPDGAVR
ncbi:signal peptidase I [Kribbia dieselivorans]|uniref:signal peptidase I n=1 Tax=Kribbia dieselivorans TaxID=331526 RepID=UPI0008394A3A|nr:signal peptidase I [Kribbia dieselivorans]